MWPLSGRGPAGALHTYRIVIDAERNAPPAPLPTHGGHDWMYVVSGRMRLLLGGDDHTIEPGEAVEFSTWTPHWFGAVDGPVEVIAILGPTASASTSTSDPPPADGRAAAAGRS